jgi:hypothetical protein
MVATFSMYMGEVLGWSQDRLGLGEFPVFGCKRGVAV